MKDIDLGRTGALGASVSTARKFVTDVLGRAIFQILSASKGLILLPILARAYGAEGYGIWSQVCITAALVSPLINLRLNEAVVRYLSGIEIDRQRGRAFFSCVLVTWGLSAGVLLVGAVALRGLSLGMFGDPDLERFVFLFLGLLVAGVSFGLVTSYYRAVSRITTNTVLNAVEMMATLAATAIIAIWLRGPLETVLAVSIAISVVLSAGCLLDIARREGGFGFSGSWVRKFLRYSLPLVPAAALYWVVNSSDRFVIVHVLDLEHAGIYSAAYRVTQIVKIIVQPLSFVLLPLMASLWERGRTAEALGYLSASLRVYLLLAVPAVAGLAAVGSALMQLLGGATAFAVSPSLIVLLSAGELFVGIYQLWVYLLYMKEKNLVLLLFFALSATLNLGGNLVLVPMLGILGAAWTTFLAYALQAILVVGYARRLVPAPFLISVALRTCVAGGAVYAAARLVPGEGWGGLVLRVVAGIVVYALLVVILRLVKREDLSWFRRGLGGGGLGDSGNVDA